jgi:hypothetical protein
MENILKDKNNFVKAFEYKNIQSSVSDVNWSNPKIIKIKSAKKSLGIFYYDFHGDIKIFDESISNRRGIVVNQHI